MNKTADGAPGGAHKGQEGDQIVMSFGDDGTGMAPATWKASA